MIRNSLNKVPIDGPTGYKSMLEWIAKDAQKEGMDFITINVISSVIQHIFSVRGALGGIPHFVINNIKGFGRWLPDPKGIKLRQKYYIERKKYRSDFSYRLKLNRAILRRSKALYSKYWHTSTAEIKMSYIIWKKATGRQRLHDQKYRDLNKIRDNFLRREREIYDYFTFRITKKKHYR